jgi:hypothetical protein
VFGSFSSLFPFVSLADGLHRRSLGFGFSTMVGSWIPLEQMAARSPSAADRRKANESENGVQLLCCQRVNIWQKNDLRTISLNGGFRQEAKDNSEGP